MVALEATYLIRSDIDDPDSPAQAHYLDITEFSRLSLPLLAVGKASELRNRPKEDWSYEARPLVRSIVPTPSLSRISCKWDSQGLKAFLCVQSFTQRKRGVRNRPGSFSKGEPEQGLADGQKTPSLDH